MMNRRIYGLVFLILSGSLIAGGAAASQTSEQFLRLLSSHPPDTRKRVYLLTTVDGFDKKELTDLRKRLSNIPKTSPAYKPARELLPTLNAKARPA